MSSPDTIGPGSGALDETSVAPQAAVREDHALAVLLAVRAQIAPELPERLLRQCYAIQRQFQFDRDEQLPIVHTRRLIESHVEHETTRQSGATKEAGA